MQENLVFQTKFEVLHKFYINPIENNLGILYNDVVALVSTTIYFEESPEIPLTRALGASSF